MPVLADGLAAPEATGAHEVEYRVKPVALGCVEEGAELLWRPHHDRAGDLTGLSPPPDAFIGPQEGLRAPAGLQLDVGRRVEGDQLLGDRGVQGRAQGAADRLTGGRAGDLPERFHLCQFGSFGGEPLPLRPDRATGRARLAAGDLLAAGLVLDRDHLVVVGYRVEHLHQVADVEPVEAYVADARLQVDADVGGVGVERGLAALLRGEPLVEPLAHGEAATEGQASPQAAQGLLDGWERRRSVSMCIRR